MPLSPVQHALRMYLPPLTTHAHPCPPEKRLASLKEQRHTQGTRLQVRIVQQATTRRPPYHSMLRNASNWLVPACMLLHTLTHHTPQVTYVHYHCHNTPHTTSHVLHTTHHKSRICTGHLGSQKGRKQHPASHSVSPGHALHEKGFACKTHYVVHCKRVRMHVDGRVATTTMHSICTCCGGARSHLCLVRLPLRIMRL